MIGFYYTLISRPYNLRFFNQIEIFSHQISNIIFLTLFCFTDFVSSEYLKEYVGRLIIVYLGFYILTMIIFVSYYGFLSIK